MLAKFIVLRLSTRSEGLILDQSKAHCCPGKRPMSIWLEHTLRLKGACIP